MDGPIITLVGVRANRRQEGECRECDLPNMGPPMTNPRRALLVIDVQNEYFDGELPIEYPDPLTSLDRIVSAAIAANAAGIPVVLVQNLTPPGTPIFAEGSRGAELHPRAAALAHALLLQKTLPSAFAGTRLLAWLVRQGITTVSVVGYMTHNCVDATIREAVHTGFDVEVLSDATGSVPYSNRAGHVSAKTIHDTFLTVMQSRFANVMTTKEWIASLAGEPLPARESIYSSNQIARAQRGRTA